METTVGEVGEFGLLERVIAATPAGTGVVVGPGDDAAVVSVPDGRVVATTDLLIEGRHFRRDWSSAEDVGRKAAAQSLADVAAMGGVATALLVGVGLPPDVAVSWATDLAAGVREEAATVGAAVVGGDVVRSEEIVVAVSALGDLGGRAAVRRSGARPGDVVAVAGRLGWSAAGLAVLSRGFRAPRVLVDAHRCPSPPYGAGPLAAAAGATAMIDVSDGLVADAGHLATASGVVLSLDGERVPVDGAVRDAAAAFNSDALAWVLTGGEDHALLACFPAHAQIPPDFVVIGAVLAASADGPGVLVDGTEVDGPGGYDHFR